MNKEFNPERYQGTWYELAKYPKLFERGCEMAVAEYTYKPRKNGLNVINKCYAYVDGKLKKIRQVHGFATITDEPHNLSLKFDNVPFSSTYTVVWTDYDNYALVGSPGWWIFGNFWLLSRYPIIGEKEMNRLLKLAEKYGFDRERIVINDKIEI